MITREKNPYDVALLAAFFLSGVAGLSLTRETSSNTLLTMPTTLLYVWHSVSTIGGGLGLLGIALLATPHRLLLGNGLLRYGLFLVGLQLTGYGLALAGLFNLKAFFVAAILLTFAWAVGRRVLRISRDIGDFRRAIKSQLEGADGLEPHPPGSGNIRGSGSPDTAVADQENEGRHRKDFS